MVSGALGGACTSSPLKFAMLFSGKWDSFLVEWGNGIGDSGKEGSVLEWNC